MITCRTSKRFAILFAITFFALCPIYSQADIKTWKGGAGDWFDGANWTNGLPADGDEVVLNRGTVLLTNGTPLLGSFTQNGGALVYSNWSTRLWATNVLIAGGTNMLPTAFTNGSMSNRIWIVCSNLFVGSNGLLTAHASGYSGGRSNENGHGPGGAVWSLYSPGGGYGGRGGKPEENYSSGLAGGTYGSVSNPTDPGSGGGAGAHVSARAGAGGGAIKIDASGTVTVNGIVSANGGNAPTDASNKWGGGGSGGGISIGCSLFAGTGGLVRANGGARGYDGYGAGGGGGRIAVNYDPGLQAAAEKPAVTFSVAAGLQGVTHETFPQISEMGTLYFPDNALLNENGVTHIGQWLVPVSDLRVNTLVVSNGTIRFPGEGFQLTVSNNLTVMGASGVLEIGSDGFSTNRFGWSWLDLKFYTGLVTGPVVRVGGTLLVTNGATLRLYSGVDNPAVPGWGCVVAVTNSFVIATGSTVRAWGNPTNGASPLIVATRLEVNRGGVLSGTEGGFAGGKPLSAGFGPGGGRTGTYPGGGGHGGRAGESYDAVLGGNAAGTPDSPLAGSGGGGGNSGSAGSRSTGGSGGALLRLIVAESVTVDGTIVSDGAQGGHSANYNWAGGAGYYAAGGSGGGIHITCGTILGSGGLIGARGSRGPRVGLSGAGAGGRIAVSYDSIAESALSPKPSILFDASAGSGGPVTTIDPANSEPGTIAMPDWTLFEPLRMNHKGQILVAGATGWAPDRLVVTNGWIRFPVSGFALTVTNDVLVTGSGSKLDIGGNLALTNWDWTGAHYPYGEMAAPSVLSCAALTLTNGGILQVFSTRTNGTTVPWGATVTVAGKVKVATNSWIYPFCQPTNGGAVKFEIGELEIQTRNAGIMADGNGFGGNSGPSWGFGPGAGRGNSYGAGAGHGGRGGSSHPSYYYTNGPAYGDSNAPALPGSSGGGGQIASFFGNGGRGGGRIHIEAAGTVTVNGTLSADGTPPRSPPGAGTPAYGGGGSGGTIWIDCRNFQGTSGLLSADGGNGGRLTYDGGGGGGRIAVRRLNDTVLSATVAGASGYSNGLAGTVRWIKYTRYTGSLMMIR